MNLISKTIKLRLIEEDDAEFVLSLRTDDKYNKFISSVSPDVEAQKKWIKSYKDDEINKKQFYFIIERREGVRCGTVRVYDLNEKSFCCGSWILNEDKTRYAALESAVLVYDFGFNELGYSMSHFDVMKGNEKVISFHEKMGARRTGEDTENIFFIIDKENILDFKRKFAKIL